MLAVHLQISMQIMHSMPRPPTSPFHDQTDGKLERSRNNEKYWQLKSRPSPKKDKYEEINPKIAIEAQITMCQF